MSMAHEQFPLFSDDAGAVQPAEPDAELTRLGAELPATLRMGTSSWTFPGWTGLVYAPRGNARRGVLEARSPGEPREGARDGGRVGRSRLLSESLLARDGLAAYAQHPLFRTVGIDRTFYAPVSAEVHARYATATPAQFRFLVKAPQELVAPQSRDGRANERFLDVDATLREFVDPAREGLADRLGVLLFQFPPLPRPMLASMRRASDDAGLLSDLHRLLAATVAAVTPEVVVAIEVRNQEFFEPRMLEQHRAGLASSGAVHCYSLHPSVPELAAQCDAFAPSTQREIVVRWMLRRNHRYEEAAEAYRPFDRLVEPDPAARSSIVELATYAESLRRPTWIIVNNKAEGSSPLSILELARETLARRRASSALPPGKVGERSEPGEGARPSRCGEHPL